jgi:hypothetical protein
MKSMLAAAAIAAAFLLPAAASAATAQVGGDWVITLATEQGNLPVPCSFVQAGATLTGTCGGGQMGDPSPITGSVTEQNFTVAYDVNVGGQPLHVVFSGQGNADNTIAGTFAAGPYNGAFTGVRGASAPTAAAAPAPAGPAAAAPPPGGGHAGH